MAKSIDLLLFLFGSVVFFYPGGNGLYVAEPTIEPRKELHAIYSKEVGVREKTNNNDGERIADYLRYTGLPEGYAWCAAFVSWAFGEAGFKEPRTAWSPSLFPNARVVWKRDGGAVQQTPAGSKGVRKTGVLPKQGDVFGIYFTNLKRIAHAGFVDEWGSIPNVVFRQIL